MAPEFLPGDSIVVDASLSPQPGSYVIAQNGSYEATFKKYRVIGYDEYGREEFELVPLNISSKRKKIFSPLLQASINIFILKISA